MIVRNSQGVQFNNLAVSKSPSGGFPIGRVFHVVIDKNSIGFNNWSDIGNVYYTELTVKPPSEITDDSIAGYKPAKPLVSSHKYFPLNGELITLIEGPTPTSSDIQNQTQVYYSNVINLYNNTNHNSPAVYNLNEDGSANLGPNTIESTTVSNTYPFEGDHIIYGRWGQGLRFSSKLTENNLENFWSITGNNGDPITLLVNGYNFSPDLRGEPYVENINNDKSSIYLTSTQTIPINIDNNITNPLISPLDPEMYSNSQIILNANRILINSNKDEVMIYSKTNISISSKNTTYISAVQNVMLDGGQYIFLGVDNGKVPTEPALLGGKTITLLNDLLTGLKALSSSLGNAVDSSNRPLISISIPATSLEGTLDNIIKKLENLKSSKVYIS
jgi:hypothetical protein